MLVFIIALTTCFLLIFIILRYKWQFMSKSEPNLWEVHIFYREPSPRIGGIAIILGVFLAMSAGYFQSAEVSIFGHLLLFSALPVFLAGFFEDITKKVGVKSRLLAAFISAGLAGYLLNAWLSNIQIMGIDDFLLTYPTAAIAITCFAVSGVTNAFNIIDGFHGLSAMIAATILTGIAYVAFQVGDPLIMIAALAMIGALAGFLVWNYPRGLIFLGDGGAYLIGFWIAELSVLLAVRHPEVSKWFLLLLCFYPIFETVFTIYRRAILRGANPGRSDSIHMHHLIYKRIMRSSPDGGYINLKNQRNLMTSLYVWLLALLPIILAILFWRYQMVLIGFSALLAIAYIWFYWSIVRFKVPAWMIIKLKN
jgi:UDP-N-acetylmuramyl pentapeptide phosphotransferase/UDP-N-acetylglucosamine-1-phosphate transferase